MGGGPWGAVGPRKGAHPKGPVGVAPKKGPRAPPSEGLAHSNQDKRPDPVAEWGPDSDCGLFFGDFGTRGTGCEFETCN